MRISATNKPWLFLSMGDPAGIGPEIIAKALAKPKIMDLAVFVIVGDSGVIKSSLRSRGREIRIVDPFSAPLSVKLGRPTPEGARRALESVKAASALAKEELLAGRPAALVTAPVDKGRIAAVSPGFVGHTEFLGDLFSAKFTVMVLVGKKLKVVPVTRHIPIKDVPSALSAGLIENTLKVVIKYKGLISGKKKPVVAVSALNPHCGENGNVGREEIELIEPAIRRCKRSYPLIEGPASADTVFYRALKGEVDIVVSMYHDQCLAPFKMVDFDDGVNMTLGLGIMRTSPDHGTAFDIAGKGIASSSSMERAIELAVKGCKAMHR